MAKSPHWSTLGESSTIIGIKILLLMYTLFGRWGFRLILYPVMTYYYLSQTRARKASSYYLQRLRPFLDPAQQEHISSFKHFIMFGEILLDKFLVWMGKIKLEDVVFETPATFDMIDNAQQGSIIIVSHLGNTEVCSALAHQFPDLKLTVLVFTQHALKFNNLLKKVNDSPRIELLQVTEMTPEVAMKLSECIEQGEHIVIAGDRTPVTGQGRVSDVAFLGETAALPQGAFILANLLKCPVYLMFCLKQQKQYHIYLELFAKQFKCKRKEREQYVNTAVQQYAHRLEYYCMKAPLQWFNFFPFWHGQ